MTNNYQYKMCHNKGGVTLRSCMKCGAPIRARNFSQRTKENKVNLCKFHLRSHITLNHLGEQAK